MATRLLSHGLGDFFAGVDANASLSDVDTRSWITSALVSTVLLVAVSWFASSFRLRGGSKLQTANEDIAEFQRHAKKLIALGFEKFKGPFKIITDIGPMIMLPPSYIDAVNASSVLSFTRFMERDFLAQYDTFRNFRHEAMGLLPEAVMKGLTRSLPKFTKPLSDEMTSCLRDTWGEEAEWHEISLRSTVLHWVARLSSLIFSGGELNRNEEWLKISKEYTVNTFTAIAYLRKFPRYLRWMVERTYPTFRNLRRDREAASRIITPILAARKAEIALAKREGREPHLPDDSIEWIRATAKGKAYEAVDIQLQLSLAAIHTTSDLIGQAILNLCLHEEMLEPLRQEAREVLGKYGWKKVALTELRVLDSFLKETQRLKPISMSTMHRVALDDVQLPGGLKILKGQKTVISAHLMWSESSYPDPLVFDGFRFIKQRQLPGYEHKSHLVSTSNDHTGFGHGKHACPGRFFAANETKIALVHMLLKYDVRLVDKEGNSAKCIENGTGMNVNPFARVEVRRRKAEVELDGLVVDG